jgi:hypothetical protein
MGAFVGFLVGGRMGAFVGFLVGGRMGNFVGFVVGGRMGALDVGIFVGRMDGDIVFGNPVGVAVGPFVGFLDGDGDLGVSTGPLVGPFVLGVAVGEVLFCFVGCLFEGAKDFDTATGEKDGDWLPTESLLGLFVGVNVEIVGIATTMRPSFIPCAHFIGRFGYK